MVVFHTPNKNVLNVFTKNLPDPGRACAVLTSENEIPQAPSLQKPLKRGSSTPDGNDIWDSPALRGHLSPLTRPATQAGCHLVSVSFVSCPYGIDLDLVAPHPS